MNVSTRWKRFAFFDRSAIGLPPDVVDDLFGGSGDDGAGAGPQGTGGKGGGAAHGLAMCRAVVPAEAFASAADADADADASSPVAAMAESASAVRRMLGGGSGSGSGADRAGGPQEVTLALMSSRGSDRIHAADLTVRCNPPPVSASPKEDGPRRGQARGGGASGSAGSDPPPPPLELDGYRGSYRPFAWGWAGSAQGAADGLSRQQRSIVAEHMSTGGDSSDASASPPPPPNVEGISACRSGSGLHVAAATASPGHTGVCVAVDPHLHLAGPVGGGRASASRPPVDCPPSKIYQPPSAFDHGTYGAPSGAIHSAPGLVAVGTAGGYVLVYGYDHQGTAGGRRQHGHGETGRLSLLIEIPPPATQAAGDDPQHRRRVEVSSVRLVPPPALPEGADSSSTSRTRLFVTYLPGPHQALSPRAAGGAGGPGGAGVSAFDLGVVSASLLASTATSASVQVGRPLARYDLDPRGIGSSALCDAVSVGVGSGASGSQTQAAPANGGGAADTVHYLVARPEGIATYSTNDKIGSVPIDGNKVCACWVPPPAASRRRYHPSSGGMASGEATAGGVSPADSGAAAAAAEAGSTHFLVSTSDSKSGRDAVDIYDTSHRIIAFHALLSPGHRAIRAVGIGGGTSLQGGLSSSVQGSGPMLSYSRHPSLNSAGMPSSAIVLTSGGSLVTLTERSTEIKISLLVQKNLYTAAISMSYADPAQGPAEVAALYRKYAEYLYDRGDFASAIEQYMNTIGNLEPGHVVLRFLDSAKVPLLVQYLVELRERGMADREHDELLKTCYIKLGDPESADRITLSGPAATARSGRDACDEVESLLADSRSKDAIAVLCSLDPDAAAKCLSSAGLGSSLVRASPREIAGIVLALCDGTFSPVGLAGTATPSAGDAAAGGESGPVPAPLSEDSVNNPGVGSGGMKRYPPHLFANSFLEHPKLLRLLLSTCRARKCTLPPDLKRALLELTLGEWSSARSNGDSAQERRKRAEVMDILTDPHSEGHGGIDPTDAFLLVQDVNFEEGITYMCEKLGLSDMLLERLAADGGDSARRSMLAMCTDAEMTAEVLGKLVGMSTIGNGAESSQMVSAENASPLSIAEAAAANNEVLADLQEALFLAQAQRADLPAIRVVRILAGEGTGKFTSSSTISSPDGPSQGVPLSVALNYVGPVLDGLRSDSHRIREDVNEYASLCSKMEEQIESLRSGNGGSSAPSEGEEETAESYLKKLSDSIPTMVGWVKQATAASATQEDSKAEQNREEFWRELSQSQDSFETIARYFSKGVIE